MKIRIYDTDIKPIVQNEKHLRELIAEVASDALQQGKLVMIFLSADNGNELGFVVGGDETVLSFTYGSLESPYFGSKGLSDRLEPVMTCFVNFDHHTEFTRKNVIPFDIGLKAINEFFQTSELPECIEWMEV